VSLDAGGGFKGPTNIIWVAHYHAMLDTVSPVNQKRTQFKVFHLQIE
jgi:hypothetical protein